MIILLGEYLTLPQVSDKPIHLRDIHTYKVHEGPSAGRRPLDPSLARIIGHLRRALLLLMQDSYADASHHLEPTYMYIHYEKRKEESVRVDMYLSVVRSSSICSKSLLSQSCKAARAAPRGSQASHT